ncbi:hypothetical protein GCM10010459_07700 [Microbacterium schleiferi]
MITRCGVSDAAAAGAATTRGVARIAVAVRRENGRNRRAGVERDINSFRLEQTLRTYEPDVTSGDAEVNAP